MALQAVPPIPEAVQFVMIFNEVVMPALGICAATFLGWLGFRTWDRQLERKRGGAATADLEELREEVRRLREGAAVTHDLDARLGEVEERLDFAERVLTRHKQGELPGPAEG